MINTPCTSRDRHGNALYTGDFLDVARKSRDSRTPHAVTRDSDGALLSSCFIRKAERGSAR
jgi:hypothetical protein